MTCLTGWTDCNLNEGDGCEVNTASDPQQCGGCGATHACPVEATKHVLTASCTNGVCGIGTCMNGWEDCNTSMNDGCETNLTLPTSCGGCTTICGGSDKCAPTCSGTTATAWGCAPGASVATSCLSCGDGLSNCGPGGDESCCASPLVSGGTFYRSWDGVLHTDSSYPATVSDFRLDRFEVTVGRFRAFVHAWNAGWRPGNGAGKHSHLNGGNGLNGGTEPGWNSSWDAEFATTMPVWNTNLANGTWTLNPGANEGMPISKLNWYEAYAFCIWDGGFLPSEAEWNYAAAGGGGTDGQRVYPWSNPPTSTTIDATYAVYLSSSPELIGSKSPNGDGKWGQADLAGNEWEWALDWHTVYDNLCNNCANLTTHSDRVLRGGSFGANASQLLSSHRYALPPTHRDSNIGARCAKTP